MPSRHLAETKIVLWYLHICVRKRCEKGGGKEINNGAIMN